MSRKLNVNINRIIDKANNRRENKCFKKQRLNVTNK